MDAAGQPFFFHADTLWALPRNASLAVAEEHFDRRVKDGFTAVLSHAFCKEAGPVKNVNGDEPFTPLDNILKPNEAYWRHVDAILAAAEKQSIQRGEWRQLLRFLNALHCDHVVLEMAFRGYDELHYFKEELDPRLGLGLGVIDIKVNTVETPELVARRIEQAANIVGVDRITWVHPDCGFWMNKRSIADRKIASLVKGRDLFLGHKSNAATGQGCE
ncbi:MAG: DUF4038 domain-containing protein [Verrucomicrobiales bacterium]|nr:DUF4038 domain-containing protein [Verrucomicrobiales bacterium]